ncbi:PilZ domain-containing protein [Thermodesulfobacteriota bacterium]
MTQTEKRERRRHTRFDINLDGNVRGIDPSEGTFQSDIEVLNISISGIYMKIHHYVDLFTKLELRMFLPVPDSRNDVVELDVNGVVVRVEPSKKKPDVKEYRIAIFFPNLNKLEKQRIQDFIKTLPPPPK